MCGGLPFQVYYTQHAHDVKVTHNDPLLVVVVSSNMRQHDNRAQSRLHIAYGTRCKGARIAYKHKCRLSGTLYVLFGRSEYMLSQGIERGEGVVLMTMSQG